VGNSVWCCNALRDAGVELETVRCEWNAGNTELHGAERCGTIQHAPQEQPLSFPFIQLFISCCPRSSLTARKHKLYYIVDHVDTYLNPLHRHSHRMHHGAYNSLTFVFWIAWNSQADSGEYSCHMDNSFTVIGQLLNTLHLPECEGVEYKLDIRAEMKRHKEDRVRQWVSNE
jgi:hypothetical protein